MRDTDATAARARRTPASDDIPDDAVPGDGELSRERYFTARFEDLALGELFGDVSPELWTEEFFRTNELANLYTDAAVSEVLARLGHPAGAPLPSPEELAEAAERWGVRTDRTISLRWLLAKAQGSRLFAEQTSSSTPIRELLPRMRERIASELPALEPALALIDVAAAAYPAFLRGEASGNEILFTADTLPLWEAYFSNANPLYRPANVLAAEAAAAVLADRARDTVAVLEVGAGCGSGAEAFFDAVSPCRSGVALERCADRYIVTDIAPGFLRTARARLEGGGIAERGAWELEVRLLDLDRPRESWRLEESSFDLVLGVNVLHCARDIAASLGRLRELLCPGGALVLGECIRPYPGRPVHPELVFQLLDTFQRADVRPTGGPRWPFLDAAEWVSAAQEAGFASVDVIPDLERVTAAYPEHSVGAVVARR